MVRKTNFLSILVLVSAIKTFMSKKKSSQWICPKMLQNNRKAYFGSMWLTFGEKQFLLIFIPFYRFYWKQLLKQIQIFLRIFRFSNMVTKTNFLSISVLVSEIATFMSKKKSSLWIPPKCIKTRERHCLAVYGTICGEKLFF